MLTKRPCLPEDRGFVYGLMKDNMADYFRRNTREGWSYEKFNRGFESSRITIFEIDGVPIGFYDIEEICDGAPYMYVRNVQVDKKKRGHGLRLIQLLDEEARKRGLNIIRGKVFRENERALLLLQHLGCSVADEELEGENSVYVEKRLDVIS